MLFCIEELRVRYPEPLTLLSIFKGTTNTNQNTLENVKCETSFEFLIQNATGAHD